MYYYSTRNKKLRKHLEEAVLEGLAPDGGLYMPERIPTLEPSLLKSFKDRDFRSIATEIALALFGDDLPEDDIRRITVEAISFDTPLLEVEPGIHTLELFHGPTLAFKDVGARFMARLLGHFTRGLDREINVLVATSGDTGSAVASGFWNVEGIKVHILYPSGGVSHLQEQQLTTLGGNITALEVKGVFDDCQHLVKQAFQDTDLKEKLILTSANSINLARLLPQSFYYFNAWARLAHDGPFNVCVPSGNFGNLTAGLVAGRMGLPIAHYIVATNVNDVVPEYLSTGNFNPRPSVPTIANAMDVGNPSNFERILDLYAHSHESIRKDMTGFAYTDDELRETIGTVYRQTGYLLEPHGAAGYRAVKAFLKNQDPSGAAIPAGIAGPLPSVFLETAHPGKFSLTVEEVIKNTVEIPQQLKEAASKEKSSVLISSQFKDLKDYLLS